MVLLYLIFGWRDAVRVAGLLRKTSVRGRQERLSAVAGLLSGPHHLRGLLARIGVEPLNMVLTDKCDHAKPGRLHIAVGQHHPPLATHTNHAPLILTALPSLPPQA